MGAPDKDLKILWGKAAGRCAITRKKLVAEASDAVPSKNILLGEVCHIVAETSRGPRGTSVLTRAERNRYPNLILLCHAEHERIDQDPTAWPIEKLHQIKADHELWVEEQLAESTNHEDEVYANLVNLISEKLRLDEWFGFSDNAIRGLISTRWMNGADEVILTVFRTIWPRKHRHLKTAIQQLADRLEAFTKFYMRHARMDSNGERFREHKFYQNFEDATGQGAAKTFMLWQSICGRLLMNLTHALNEYADAVRATIKPDYFYVSGKFVVFDFMGVTNQMESVSYLPKDFQNLRAKIRRYERWLRLLRHGNGDKVFVEWDKVANAQRESKKSARRINFS